MDIKIIYLFTLSIEISNRFAASQSLDENFDINKAWESIREDIKISAKNTLRY
jgi:hypothetical protein